MHIIIHIFFQINIECTTEFQVGTHQLSLEKICFSFSFACALILNILIYMPAYFQIVSSISLCTYKKIITIRNE